MGLGILELEVWIVVEVFKMVFRGSFRISWFLQDTVFLARLVAVRMMNQLKLRTRGISKFNA